MSKIGFLICHILPTPPISLWFSLLPQLVSGSVFPISLNVNTLKQMSRIETWKASKSLLANLLMSKCPPPGVMGISLASLSLSTSLHHHHLSPKHIFSHLHCSPDWAFCTYWTHPTFTSILNTIARVLCTKCTSNSVTPQPPSPVHTFHSLLSYL